MAAVARLFSYLRDDLFLETVDKRDHVALFGPIKCQ